LVDLQIVGLLLVFLGFVLLLVAMVRDAGGSERGSVRGAGVLLIGPIPIVWGSNAKWATVAIMLAIVLVVLTFLLPILLG
jgi:uncharacterized protein (TIGR00304 family)